MPHRMNLPSESDGSTIHLVSAFFWGGINSTWLGPSTNWLLSFTEGFRTLALISPMAYAADFSPIKIWGYQGVPYFQANLSGPFVKFLEITYLEICEKSVRLVVFGIHETSNYEKQMVCFYHTFPSESMTQPSLSCTSPVWPSQNWIDSIDSSTQTTQGMDLWDAFLVAHFFYHGYPFLIYGSYSNCFSIFSIIRQPLLIWDL